MEPGAPRVAASWPTRWTVSDRTVVMIVSVVLFVEVVIRVRNAPVPHSYSVREVASVISVIVSSVIVVQC